MVNVCFWLVEWYMRRYNAGQLYLQLVKILTLYVTSMLCAFQYLRKNSPCNHICVVTQVHHSLCTFISDWPNTSVVLLPLKTQPNICGSAMYKRFSIFVDDGPIYFYCPTFPLNSIAQLFLWTLQWHWKKWTQGQLSCISLFALTLMSYQGLNKYRPPINK